jgi:predicted GNAT family acetyltransferase
MDNTVRHEPDFHRFRVESDGRDAILMYLRSGDTMVFTHTEVPAEMEGQGVGGQLAKAGLQYARENALTVVPRCPFVTSYLNRHPEYQDLVAT